MADPEAPAPPSPEIGRVEWWIKTLTANAAALRNAGVTDIRVGDFAATLRPKDPVQPTYEDVKNEEQIGDLPAIHDPRTYPGGVVPGFTIERLPQED